MQIQLASPPVREDGDFTVYVNGSGMKKGSAPFAVIQLDENGSVDLTFHEPGDLDRLIAAACQAKSLLVASRTPHPYRGADTSSSRCGDCGVMKGHHPEPEPDAAAVLAEAIKHGTPVIVTDDEDANVHWGNSGGGIPEPALEGTVTAPPQDAPLAEVIRANPPHYYFPGGEFCGATDANFVCLAQPGHDGPEHLAYDSHGQICRRWPVTATAQVLNGAGRGTAG